MLTRRQLLAAAAVRPPQLTSFFDEIVSGFLRNASPGYAVCDFPGGTRLKSCVARSGKTYIGVARMLPALASSRRPDLQPVLLAIFRNAFDPAHPDYWEEPPPDRANQRQVEASLVAWSLCRLGDRFLARLTSRERANIQRWLASCTRVAERKHNHAWFSAVNQAARLRLAQRWKEFSGDEQWMLEDLKALEGMGTPGDGWYQDSVTLPIFDYYNFWTFASHYLEWRQIAGQRYPRVDAVFRERLLLFLKNTPYFFAANGSHPLYGRSLIYRWALLAPLVMAYEQKLWPHSPGLLRRIVRLSLDYHRRIGSYDPELGKLRETYSARGTPDIREFYIDNGHPYWCMQAYSFLALPPADPFWTAPEEPLPVERGDFLVRFEGPRMLLAGARASGGVRWVQARCEYHHLRYRDKYIKFSAWSHFPFNVMASPDQCPWDNALVFRDPATGRMTARTRVVSGELTPDGVRMEWEAGAVRVRTRLRLAGECEYREHEVSGAAGLEVLEGSPPLGIETDYTARDGILRNGDSCVASWNLGGFETLTQDAASGINAIHPRMVLNSLRCRGRERMELRSLHYASPKAAGDAELARIRRQFT